MKRLVLKASAGTGKTYRLSLEYLLSLYRGIPYSEIFVMTFTRKATAEIRERILEFSAEILSHSEKGKELVEHLQALDSTLFLKEEVLKAAYDSMLKNKDMIRIYTIDSFFQMLFHKLVCPYYQIYSMKMIETEEENKEYYKKILKHIFSKEELFEKMKVFFDLSPEKNIENYLLLIQNILQERWKFLLLQGEQRKRTPLSFEKTREEHIKAFQALFQAVEETKKKERGYFTHPFYQNFFEQTEEEREETLTKERERFFDTNVFDGRRLSNRGKDEKILSLREELLEETDSFRRDLAKEVYNQDMIAFEESLFSIFEELYQLYDEYKRKERSFNYDDIAIYTYLTLFQEELHLIENNKITALLEEILDVKIHSIFLDEFQDTSILQWKILSVFLEKAKTVICVGDEKQSIYGWRGGEKKLFEDLPKILGAEVEHLDTSYRSLESIVEFCNEFFKSYPALYQEEAIEWKFLESKSHKQKRGEVLSYFLSEEDSLQALLSMIEEKYSGNYGSLSILARKNKTLLQLADFLEEHKLPYQLSIVKEQQDEEIVSSFLSLFRYFCSNEYLYLLEFFRSPVIKASNRILKNLLTHQENMIQYICFGKEWKEKPKGSEEIFELYREFQENEGKIGDLWLHCIEKFSLPERFSKDSHLLAYYSFQESLSYYDTWFEYLEDLDRNRLPKLDIREEENKNAIQLMSIHKSKGLEFENVIYFEPKEKRKGRKEQNILFYFQMADDYCSLEHYFLTKGKYRKYMEYLPKPFPNYLKDLERKEKEEEINTLYVALTRAKHNLYLFFNETFQGRELLEKLSFVSSEMFTESKEETKLKEEKQGIVLTFQKEKKSFEEDRKQRPQKYTLQTELHRMEGLATHFFLEHIRYATEEEIRFAKQRVFQEYASYFGMEKMEQLFSEERIRKILTLDSDIFSRDWDYIYPEFSIISPMDQKKYVLDRLMIRKAKKGKKGLVYIVDYKTGGKDPKQLKNYEQILRELFKREEGEYEFQTKFLELGREGE